MSLQYRIEDKGEWKLEQLRIHTPEQPDFKARMAIALVERWGMVAGIPDGEDSAGRTKLRLQTPNELVARACETADVLWRECLGRGWVFEVPAPEGYKDTKPISSDPA